MQFYSHFFVKYESINKYTCVGWGIVGKNINYSCSAQIVVIDLQHVLLSRDVCVDVRVRECLLSPNMQR